MMENWFQKANGSLRGWVWLAVLLGLIVGGQLLSAGHTGKTYANCFTEWDGRSNPTVCD